MVRRKRKKKIPDYEIKTFYRSFDTIFFIFPSTEIADECPVSEIASKEANPGLWSISLKAKDWSKILKSQIFEYNIGDPVFLIEKDWGGSAEEEYWHVIIGDKIGWIVINTESKLEKIES